MATPRFSHLRAGDLATLSWEDTSVPVRVVKVHDGNSATVEATATRAGVMDKGMRDSVTDNLRTQSLTSRTKSGTPLLVF